MLLVLDICYTVLSHLIPYQNTLLVFIPPVHSLSPYYCTLHFLLNIIRANCRNVISKEGIRINQTISSIDWDSEVLVYCDLKISTNDVYFLFSATDLTHVTLWCIPAERVIRQTFKQSSTAQYLFCMPLASRLAVAAAGLGSKAFLNLVCSSVKVHGLHHLLSALDEDKRKGRGIITGTLLFVEWRLSWDRRAEGIIWEQMVYLI